MATYPQTVTCQHESCTWSHQAQDQDDAIDAWEAHTFTGCPQPETPSSAGPDDPIGTVRATNGLLAVRAHSANPDHPDDLVWYVIDIGVDELPDNVEHQLHTWPVVYQP